MKLNNGKGWENMKAHPSVAHLQNPNAHQNPSTAVNVHGQAHRQQKTHLPIDHHRLNADLPKPGATRGPPGRGPGAIQQQGKYPHPDAVKRKSMGELAPPEGSNHAQFQASQPNLTTSRQTPLQSPSAAQPRQPPTEEKPSFGKKIMNALCCGAGSS
jgi:casein kinase 1